MIESGEECHIVNTSSMAGLISSSEEGLYNVTKYGVVALSESLRQQMQMLRTKVGVSVLCPGLTRTNIMENSKNLADEKQGLYKIPDDIMKLYEPAIENIRRRLDEGLESRIMTKSQKKLKDGTPAIEGEIEVQLSHKANQFIIFVLAAIRKGKLICINLSSFEVAYNDQMKRKLREIAYTLKFG